MNGDHILQIKETFDTDESIRRYEYIAYQPITGTSLNTTGEIRIVIESQDEFFHPSQAYFLIEGQLLKGDGGVYGDDDKVALVNNGMMFLFSNIRYELSGHEIESVNYPGQATTIKGLLKYSEDYTTSQGMNHCWMKASSDIADQATNAGFKARQNYIIKGPTPNGSFSFVIPLKHIFGFAEDYDKITYGLRHVLTLVRQSDDDSIFRGAAVAKGMVKLSKIALHMPRVLPNDQEKLSLMKVIESRSKIDVGFRMHQCDTITVPQSTTFSWRLTVRTSPENPRWVIVAFQTDRVGNQEKNTATFDNCKAKRVWVELNGNPYPSLEHNTSFEKHQIATLYNAVSEFLPNYYGMENGQSNISASDFISLYSFHVINISKQPERIKHGVMDMNLRAVFHTAVPDKTQAYALVISDRILSFQSDGTKMNVTY